MTIDLEGEVESPNTISKRSTKGSVRKRPRTWRTWKYTAGNYLFILPFMLVFTLFFIIPIFRSIYISFFNWPILGAAPKYIGLGNYASMLKDSLWWVTLKNTVYFTLLISFGTTLIAFLVALLVVKPVPGQGFFRFVFYAPIVLSVSAMGIIWRWMFNTNFGIINYFLSLVGISPVEWLATANLVIPAISVASIWWGFGFPMVIFVAGFQNIPSHLFEAAEIDGASKWQVFRYITLPLMLPIIFFVLVTQIISHFQIFGQPYVITELGPGNASFPAIAYLYWTAWRYYRMGYGSALAITLAAIMMIITLLQFRVFGRRATIEY